MSEDKALWRVAIHEASHAIRGWWSGCRLSSVSISANGDGETLMTHNVTKHIHKIKWPDELLMDFVDCMLAGISACHYENCNIKSNQMPENSGTDDVEIAMQVLKTCGWESDKCFSENDFYKSFSISSKLFVVSHFREIRLLASELVRLREISGYSAVKYIEGIWHGPLPEKALRYWEHKD